MCPRPLHSRMVVPERGSFMHIHESKALWGKDHLSTRCPCPAEEHLGPRCLEWVEAEARKLDSRLKRDMQIFIGLNKQPSKLQLQRGWSWGRTWLAPVSISKVVTM